MRACECAEHHLIISFYTENCEDDEYVCECRVSDEQWEDDIISALLGSQNGQSSGIIYVFMLLSDFFRNLF